MDKVSNYFKDWNYKKTCKAMLHCLFGAVRHRYDVGLRRRKESSAQITHLFRCFAIQDC